MNASAHEFDPEGKGNSAIRLIINFTGTRLRVVSQQRIEMLAPPSDPVDEYEKKSGFWVELRDENDRVIYRRVIKNPIEFEREAPSGDPERPFTHVKTEKTEGTFMLIVPDIAQSKTMTLHSSPTADRARAAKEILRIDLKEPPQRKKGRK